MEPDNSIKAKIAKLLALAKSAEEMGSLEEANTAAAHAQKLLFKHNLSLEDVEGAQYRPSSIPIEAIKFSYKDIWKKNEGRFVADMYFATARYNGARAINSPLEFSIYLVATRETAEVINYMVVSLIEKFRYACRRSWSQYTGTTLKGSYYRSFLEGAVAGLTRKFHDAKEEVMRETNSTALVLRKDKELDEAVTRFFPRLGKSKARGTSSKAGFESGFSTGYNSQTHKGVGGRSERGQLN